MTQTARLGLTREAWSSQVADALDRIAVLFEEHRHDGTGATLTAPSVAPTLNALDSGGVLFASTRYYYKISYVDQFGGETIAGPEASVLTPTGVLPPTPPTLENVAGGTLKKGLYYYALTAIKGGTETALSPSNFVYVDPSLGNSVTLTWSYSDVTAQVSVWRRSSFSSGWTRITTATAGATTYTDNGSVAEDDCACDDGDQPPTSTQASASCSVTISLGEALPTGTAAWLIYVSRVAGSYSTPAVVHRVVEVDGSDDLLTSWIDIGDVRTIGVPLTAASTIQLPPPVVTLIGTTDPSIDATTFPDGVLYLNKAHREFWEVNSGVWLKISNILIDGSGGAWSLTVDTSGVLSTTSV